MADNNPKTTVQKPKTTQKPEPQATDEKPVLASVDKIFDSAGITPDDVPPFKSLAGMMPVQRVAVKADLADLFDRAQDISADGNNESDAASLLRMIPIMDKIQIMLLDWAENREDMEKWLTSLPGDGIQAVLAAFAKLAQSLGN